MIPISVSNVSDAIRYRTTMWLPYTVVMLCCTGFTSEKPPRYSGQSMYAVSTSSAYDTYISRFTMPQQFTVCLWYQVTATTSWSYYNFMYFSGNPRMSLGIINSNTMGVRLINQLYSFPFGYPSHPGNLRNWWHM